MSDGQDPRSGEAGDGGAPPPPPLPPGSIPEAPSPHGKSRAFARGAKVTAHGIAVAGRATGRATRVTLRHGHRLAGAHGAKESGLHRQVELHAANTAGDAAVAIALAGTIFFSGATSDQRSQVALFLILTMLPFAFVAPLIGPFLDRFSHGRRWAIGATFALRACLCWVLAGAVTADSLEAAAYPAALGVLVCSKAYGVMKAAAIPRLRPEGMELPKANGRVSLAGIVGVVISAPIAGAASYFGSDWALRYAFFVFVIGTVAAILMPAKVDSRAPDIPPGQKAPRVINPPEVAFALRVTCGPRWVMGFLTIYAAFLLRENPIGDWDGTLLLGVVVGAAGLGQAVGIVTASVARKFNPAIIVVAMLLADIIVLLAAAIFYNLPTVVALGFTAGLAQYLAIVSMQSTIQHQIPTKSHGTAFARCDTTLQFVWVMGGIVGILIPLIPAIGLGFGAILLAAWAALVLVWWPRRGQAGQNRVDSPGTGHDSPVPPPPPPGPGRLDTSAARPSPPPHRQT